jgi:hypothetical protein
MSQIDSEIYARRLLPKGRGYPLFVPEPMALLPPEYRERGASIGDVGRVTPNGSFSFLFNICLPADHPINLGRTPDDFEYVQLNNSLDVMFEPHMYSTGTHIASTLVQKQAIGGDFSSLDNACVYWINIRVFNHFMTTLSLSLMPAGFGAGLKFTSGTSEGGILVLPKGGESWDLESVGKLRDHALLHAYSWYRHVNVTLRRMAPTGSLYVVTGCDKAITWGVASFSSSLSGSGISFKVSAAQVTELGASYECSWERHSPAMVRVGPDFYSGGQQQPRNQCVFIRGFKISIQEGLRAKLTKPVKLMNIVGAKPKDILPGKSVGNIPFDRSRLPSSDSGSSGQGASDCLESSSCCSTPSAEDVSDCSVTLEPFPVIP